MTIGHRDELGFSLRWAGIESGSAADVTRGELVLCIGGDPIWGSTGNCKPSGEQVDGFEWTWVKFLEFLGEAWPHLEWEQAYPAPLNPLSPMDIETEIERIRASESREYADLLQEEIISFLEVDDLACALRGAAMEMEAYRWVADEAVRSSARPLMSGGSVGQLRSARA